MAEGLSAVIGGATRPARGWVEQLADSADRAKAILGLRPRDDPDPFDVVIATNVPLHYVEHELVGLPPRGDWIVVFRRTEPVLQFALPETVEELIEAYEKFGNLPMDFEDAGAR